MVKPYLRTALLFVALCLALFSLSLALKHAERRPDLALHDFAKNDIIPYWSAYQLYATGQNPYDQQKLFVVEQAISPNLTKPKIVWNPPWFFPLSAPLLNLPFQFTVNTLALFNFAFVIPLLFFVNGIFASGQRLHPAQLLLSAAFIPIWENLIFGQLAGLIALAIAAALWCLKQGWDRSAGLLLTVLLIKPHLAYLLLPFLAWRSLKTRRYNLFIAFGAGVAAITAASFIQSPLAWSWWLQQDRSATVYQATTIVTAVRVLLLYIHPAVSFWPVIVIPALTLGGMLLWLDRHGDATNWETHIPGVLCLSFLTAPYGWTFDQSVLVIAQSATLILALQRGFQGRRLLQIVLVLLALQVLRSATIGITDLMWSAFWYPTGLFAVWAYIVRKPLVKTAAVR